MASPRGEFSSRFGFLMAAAGSAVGLGNIWGFPTNAASNGGRSVFICLPLARVCSSLSRTDGRTDNRSSRAC